MLPGPSQFIECPSCKNYQLRESLLSGNNAGAMYFTDGKMIAPFLPEFPYFVTCPECKCFFIIKKERITDGWSFEEINKIKEKIGDKKLSHVNFLSIQEYETAVNIGLFNMDKSEDIFEDDLFNLRICAWRAFNDRIRHNAQNSIWNNKDEENFYKSNCNELLSMLADSTEECAYLYQAEIYRNLSEFDKCKDILNKMTEEYKSYIKVIQQECDKNNTLTVCLKSNIKIM